MSLATDEWFRLRELDRENHELKRANEMLRKASACFAQAELDRPPEVMVSFIGEHRDALGGEPICAQLPSAPSTYYAWKRQQARSDAPIEARAA